MSSVGLSRLPLEMREILTQHLLRRRPSCGARLSGWPKQRRPGSLAGFRTVVGRLKGPVARRSGRERPSARGMGSSPLHRLILAATPRARPPAYRLAGFERFTMATVARQRSYCTPRLPAVSVPHRTDSALASPSIQTSTFLLAAQAMNVWRVLERAGRALNGCSCGGSGFTSAFTDDLNFAREDYRIRPAG